MVVVIVIVDDDDDDDSELELPFVMDFSFCCSFSHVSPSAFAKCSSTESADRALSALSLLESSVVWPLLVMRGREAEAEAEAAEAAEVGVAEENTLW